MLAAAVTDRNILQFNGPDFQQLTLAKWSKMDLDIITYAPNSSHVTMATHNQT